MLLQLYLILPIKTRRIQKGVEKEKSIGANCDIFPFLGRYWYGFEMLS